MQLNAKVLMTLSALVMGLAGMTFSFLPDEILSYLSPTTGTSSEALIFQILGALYFAFSMVNWTAKANLIGGIYGRPIAIGNLCHFTMGALALIKGYFSSHDIVILASSAIYSVFAILFTIVFFRHPFRAKLNNLPNNT